MRAHWLAHGHSATYDTHIHALVHASTGVFILEKYTDSNIKLTSGIYKAK